VFLYGRKTTGYSKWSGEKNGTTGKVDGGIELEFNGDFRRKWEVDETKCL
jgi:hypothetical protein